MKSCGDAVFRVGVAGISEAPVSSTQVSSTHVWGEASPHLPDMTQSAVLDRNHLARITLADEALEREVLGLFHRQAAMLLGRMANQAPRVIAALAHTLTGSARGIGAWQVAAAAEAVERAAAGSEQAGIEAAIGRLSTAVTQVQAAIAGLTQVC